MRRVFWVLFLANRQELIASYFCYLFPYQAILPLFTALQVGVVYINRNILVSQAACNPFHAVVVVFGVKAVVIKVYVGIGVEHGGARVKVHCLKSAVHPVGRQIHAVLVGAGGASVVAVQGVEKPVVAVHTQVAVRAKTVEFLGNSGGDGYMSFFVSHLKVVFY